MKMNELKYAVQVVILNDNGEVLAVSRKDNHEDFGLVGGKVDEEDYQHGLYEPLIAAIIRETKEETGLTLYEGNLIPIFSMHRNGYMGHTYLATKWEGEISTDEPHVVKWVPFETVMTGTFGQWNTMVANSLASMGVEFKSSPDPEDEYYFEVLEDDDFSEVPQVYIVSKTHWESDGCLSDSMNENEYRDIGYLCSNGQVQLGEAMESIFEVQGIVDGKVKWLTDKEDIEERLLKAGFKKNEEFSNFIKE